MMRILRVPGAGRMVACLGLAAVLAAPVGCDAPAGGPTPNTDPKNNPGVSLKNARVKAYGESGVIKSPVGGRK